MLKYKIILFIKKLFFIERVNENDNIFLKFNFLGLTFKIRDYIKEIDSLNEKFSKQSEQINCIISENQLLRTILEKSVDIKKVPAATGNLRKVQLIKTKLLELAAIILKQNNISFWLDYGTLIGAIRHNGFVPWDDDIDVSLLKEDILKLPKIFEVLTNNNSDFKFTHENIYVSIPRLFYKDFCIDFFSFEYINDKCNSEDAKANFARKWYKIHTKFNENYDFKKFIKSKNIDDAFEYTLNLKKEIISDNYAENKDSEQIIYSPEFTFIADKCAVIDTKCLFPLKEENFEGLVLTIPNDAIEYLYEHKLYGAKGSVMSFPKITDNGFYHTQNSYENIDIDLDKIYNELSDIVNSFK